MHGSVAGDSWGRQRGFPARASAFLCVSLFLPLLVTFGFPSAAGAQDHATCFECHSDRTLSVERGGRAVSLFVDEAVFKKSVHKDLDCSACHSDVNPEDLPHPEGLKQVACGDCHDDAQVDFAASIHGQAWNRKAPYAPWCTDCHGTHDILSSKNPQAKTFKTNVPYTCGECHREGAPVARTYEISEHNILENYSESMHGEALFKKGLTVAATCSDCHRPHLILPHTDPRSSISPRNVAATCMQCHSRIEQVHVQVIRGELWEKSPGSIPACIDCHLPHKVRKEIVSLTLSDRDCLKCHSNPELRRAAPADTVSLFVDKAALAGSTHQNIPCVKCHSDVDPRLRRPCETANKANCSNCHAKMEEEYAQSGHGRAAAEGVTNAPSCTTCHGDHAVKSQKDENSPTYRAAVPALCGTCHKAGGKAIQSKADITQPAAFADYSASVHGRGLTEKGLLPSAICIDCHGVHLILSHTDDRSSVNFRNIPATCATCHRGIYKQFTKSIHFRGVGSSEEKRLPICSDCHSAHTIQHVEQDQFMTEVTAQCGSCHQELAATYLETMHGKAYKLGYVGAAKCSDCHGAHQILAVTDPNSSVGITNIVATCKKCHADASARFTGYLTHATHHDQKRYPALFYTYWAMTGLLVGVFGFFGLHTLLWLPRSFRHLGERRSRAKTKTTDKEEKYFIRRFGRAERITHIFVMVSFISLALTGMMLKFSGMEWAGYLSRTLGGVRVAGVIHRTAAVMTFGYFAFHISTLVRKKRARRLSWRSLLLGPESLMFNRRDIADFWGTLKWFFDKGPRPEYGRWTYWEKFDYLAVFWGVAVIGFSGLMLWFPEFFTKFLPGALINVATIIHSDEALLAVGFIFTVHFFNTHLRPESFPMDTVIFTGVAPVTEYRRDRPREYEAMKASGELGKRVVLWKPNPTRDRLVRVYGYFFLTVGIILVLLILYSVLRGYV